MSEYQRYCDYRHGNLTRPDATTRLPLLFPVLGVLGAASTTTAATREDHGDQNHCEETDDADGGTNDVADVLDQPLIPMICPRLTEGDYGWSVLWGHWSENRRLYDVVKEAVGHPIDGDESGWDLVFDIPHWTHCNRCVSISGRGPTSGTREEKEKRRYDNVTGHDVTTIGPCRTGNRFGFFPMCYRDTTVITCMWLCDQMWSTGDHKTVDTSIENELWKSTWL